MPAPKRGQEHVGELVLGHHNADGHECVPRLARRPQALGSVQQDALAGDLSTDTGEEAAILVARGLGNER